MLKYLYVSPATFLVLLVGRGGARLAAGAMGTVVALVFAVIVLGLRIDLAAVNWPLLVVVARAGHRADPRDRRAARRDLPPDAPGELVLPGRVRRGDVPDQRRRVPARRAARPASQAARPRQPGHLVGRRACASRVVPDGPSSIGGAGSLWTAVTGTAAPDATTILCRLVRDRGAGYTRGDRHLPIERAPRARPGPARPDHRLVASRSGAPGRGLGRRSEGAAMRIYEGSPRQDFEEVFRSIGAFLDAHGMRDILLLEVPGRVHRPGPRGGRRLDVGAWSETIGSHRQGDPVPSSTTTSRSSWRRPSRRRGERRRRPPDHGGNHERALRVIGHWIDEQKPQGRVPVRAGRRVRRPAPRRRPGGRPPRARGVHARRRGRARSQPARPAASRAKPDAASAERPLAGP